MKNLGLKGRLTLDISNYVSFCHHDKIHEKVIIKGWLFELILDVSICNGWGLSPCPMVRWNIVTEKGFSLDAENRREEGKRGREEQKEEDREHTQ